MIYGNNQPPVTISVDDADLRQRILAGRFLTTIYDIDLEGKKHRVIPRDFHLDPVRDFPLHVDFMRLGEGATIRVSVPLHIQNAEAAPGVKRGGTVNIVTHTIDLECSVDNIPQYIEADVSGLEISHSLHLSDIKLPAGVKSLSREDVTLVTIVPPSGYAEELKAAAAAAAAGPAAAAAAPGAAPAAGAAAAPAAVRLLRLAPRLRRPAPRRLPAVATRRSNRARDAASCDSFVGLGNPGAKYAHNRHNIGFMAVDEIARRHGFAPWRRRFQGETVGRHARSRAGDAAAADDLHERFRARGAGGREFLQAVGGEITVFQDELELPPAKVRVKVGGGIAGHNGLRSISAHIGNDYRRVRLGIGHPGVKELVHSHVLSDFAKGDRPWVEALCEAVADNAGAARHGPRLDVPEQGASGDAGQGIFRQGR